MRNILLPLTTIAAVALSGAAFAETAAKPAPQKTAQKVAHKVVVRAKLETATGVVKKFDAKAHALTLADGQAFHLRKSYKSWVFKPGEKVVVKWEAKGKAHEALRVYPVHVAQAAKPAKPATAKANG